MTNQQNETVEEVVEVQNEESTVVNVESEENEVTETFIKEQKETLAKLEESNKTLLEEIQENKKRHAKLQLDFALSREKLDAFIGIEDINDMSNDEMVAFLKNAVNEILLQHSYQPKDTAKQDAYDAAIQKGDVQGALKNKFAKFFK